MRQEPISESVWYSAELVDLAHIPLGDVKNERTHYEGQQAGLDAVWRRYTPPSEGKPYTHASRKQQQHMARQVVARQYRAWVMFVPEYGLENEMYRCVE